jgi:tetratricopeptide (TPR) repeat protein
VVLVTNRRGIIRWEMTPHTESYPRYAYETNTYAFAGDRQKASQSIESGLAAASQQNLQVAMDHFGEAVTQDPSYFEALFNLAITARKAGRSWIAMRAFESSLWVRPEHEPARMQFAALLYQNNYLIDAAQEWETVLRENPDQVQAHFLMGRLLDLDFRRPDLAKRHYQKVIQLEPNHPQAENIRTWLAWFP